MFRFDDIFMKIVLVLLSLTLSVLAYEDSDFDGVSDSKDLCPNTSFDFIVDNYGCPQSKNITVLLGQELSQGSYGGTEEITTELSTVLVAYNHRDWGLSTWTSRSSTRSSSSETSGSGDVFMTVSYYDLGTNTHLLSLQAGVKIATADTTIGTGENDYNVRLSSVVLDGKLSYLSSIGYTLTGDSATISYNDTLNLSAGLGKQINRDLYLSASVNYVSAYIKGADSALSAVAYVAYTMLEDYFITGSYALGLSDAVADESFNLSIGMKL